MARRGIELEAKFAPADEATLAALAAREDFPGWRIAGRHQEAQQNTYYDTADGALEANSCSLRRRLLDGGRGGVEWTFKRGRGPGRDGIARRREVNALLPSNRADIARAKCEPVARAQRVVGSRPLLPLFTLLTTRTQIELDRDDGTRVALALDRLRMEGEPGYCETEIEIELMDGDERGLAQLAVWLMHTYGVLPMRGSKRGRAITWKRGEGLPVVAPDLALTLLAERTDLLSHRVKGRPMIIAIAAPRGSEQARALATLLAACLPGARRAADRAAIEPSARVAILDGPDVLDNGPFDLGVWTKVSLSHDVLARLIDGALAAGTDEWTILRRCGEYVVPSQRRFIDPAAHWADIVVINNAPPAEGCAQFATPQQQLKLVGWPSADALAATGATLSGTDREEDHFLRPPATPEGELLRVRLSEDTAWVSFRDPGDGSTAQVATHEARPRFLPLLHNLGYRDAGQLTKLRRRYCLGGWEFALDHVAGLGRYCELRQVAPDPRDAAQIAAMLGLAGAETTIATYLTLAEAARAAFAPVPGDTAVG
jgi:adenylate cyclase class IV